MGRSRVCWPSIGAIQEMNVFSAIWQHILPSWKTRIDSIGSYEERAMADIVIKFRNITSLIFK